MTCRIAYADEYEPVRLLRQLNSLWSPHLPCDRVVHVASYIGASTLVQAVLQLQSIA
jgi:hypothetical protein